MIRSTMEEVWQEIDRSCLLDRPRHGRGSASSTFHTGGTASVSLQDFLARPFHRDKNKNKNNNSTNPSSRHLSTVDSFIAAFPRPPPATALSLASRSDSSNNFPDKIRADPPPQLHACSSRDDPLLCKDRLAPLEDGDDDHSEQKRKRLMKNRESAARSRAKKRAYTNDLETEVIQLQEENAKLRRQYHELRILAGPAVLPEKKGHRRTLTAPF